LFYGAVVQVADHVDVVVQQQQVQVTVPFIIKENRMGAVSRVGQAVSLHLVLEDRYVVFSAPLIDEQLVFRVRARYPAGIAKIDI